MVPYKVFFTSLPLPFGRLSPDLLSSIAGSQELRGQQSPRRSNISIPKTVHGDRRIYHRPWRPHSEDIWGNAIYPLNILLSLRMDNGVERHFIGLFEEVHRSSEHLEIIRLQVGPKVLLRIPFFQKKEPIFVRDTSTEVTAPATLLHPYGTGQ